MAWHRRLGLLGLLLFVAPVLVARPAAMDPLVFNSVTPNTSTTVPAGTAMTWTVSASGGTGPLQYQYWICDNVGWQLIQGYSTSNVFTYVPPKAGSYALSVYIRSAGSSSAYEAYSPNTYFTATAAPIRIDSVSPMLYAPVTVNQAINWTVQASGGDELLMFQYWIDDGSGWSLKAGWTSGTTFSYTPTHAGRHALSVYVRRYSSTAAYEAFSPNIYFTAAGSGAPGVGSLAYYVDTGSTLDASKTCNADYLQRLTGAGLQSEVSLRSPGTITYNWDFTAHDLHAELDQFGYQPQYVPGRVSFATNGRPMIRDQDSNLTLRVMGDNGTWSGVSLLTAAQSSLTAQGYTWTSQNQIIGDFASESRIVYDKNCNAYAVIDAVRSSLTNGSTIHRSILMHSMDGGRSWAAYLIPDPNISGVTDYAVNMEVPTASHVLEGPPALLLHPRGYNQIDNPSLPSTPTVLKLVTPTRAWDGTLTLGGPYLISDHAVTGAGIAGSENYAVSAGDHIYVVYPGDTVAQDSISTTLRETTIRGTPAYAVIFSRSDQSVTSPVQIGVGASWQDASIVDDHNQPVIARDSQGYLHVMIGGHNGPIYYRKSTAADSVSNWSTAEIVGDSPSTNSITTAKYTYPSLILDRSDQPFVAARTSAGYAYAFKLVAMRRKATTPYWETEKTLVHPGRAYYGNWYHKLSPDPWGRLFVSYGYFPAQLFTDEATILQTTYGWSLSETSPSTCTPTAHNATSPQPCDYSGVQITNFTVLAADINQSWSSLNFEPATSGSFIGIGPRVWLDTANVASGHSVEAAWSGIAGPSLSDKISLFQLGAGDSSYVTQKYTGTCGSSAGSTTPTAGHCTFTSLTSGTYEIRLISGGVPIAASRQFIVP